MATRTLFVFAGAGGATDELAPRGPSAHGRPAGRRPGVRGGTGAGRHDRDRWPPRARGHPGRATARAVPPAGVLLRGAPRPGVCAAAHRRGRDGRRSSGSWTRSSTSGTGRPGSSSGRPRAGPRSTPAAWSASRRREPCGSCSVGRLASRDGCAAGTGRRTPARAASRRSRPPTSRSWRGGARGSSTPRSPCSRPPSRTSAATWLTCGGRGCPQLEVRRVSGNHLDLTQTAAGAERLARAVDSALEAPRAAAQGAGREHLPVAGGRQARRRAPRGRLHGRRHRTARQRAARRLGRPAQLPTGLADPIRSLRTRDRRVGRRRRRPLRRPHPPRPALLHARSDPRTGREPACASASSVRSGHRTRSPASYSRASLMAIARESGVICPPTATVSSARDVSAWFARNPGPAVLKTDGSWGGRGVADPAQRGRRTAGLARDAPPRRSSAR